MSELEVREKNLTMLSRYLVGYLRSKSFSKGYLLKEAGFTPESTYNELINWLKERDPHCIFWQVPPGYYEIGKKLYPEQIMQYIGREQIQVLKEVGT